MQKVIVALYKRQYCHRSAIESTKFLISLLPHKIHLLSRCYIKRQTFEVLSTMIHHPHLQDACIDTVTESKTMMAKTKKSVSFAFNLRMKPTIHNKDYTEDEAQATWYTEEEQAAMCNEVKSTIEFMAKKTKANSGSSSFFTTTTSEEMTQCCSRGLEFHRCPELWAQRKRVQANARNAVLSEQEFQARNDIYDDERIASVYSALTQESQLVASMLGASDEKVARQYYCEYRLCSRRGCDSNTSSSYPSTPLNRRSRRIVPKKSEEALLAMIAVGRGEKRCLLRHDV